MSVPFNMLCFHNPSQLVKFDSDDADCLYRYDWIHDSLYSQRFKIIRKTEKGVWIDHWGKEKFVLLTARKQFACKTQDEALISFIARKNASISTHLSQLERAKEALKFAKESISL